MGIHLATKGFDIKSLAHPTSISPRPNAIRSQRSSFITIPKIVIQRIAKKVAIHPYPQKVVIHPPSKSCHSERSEEPLYFAFAFAVFLP
jgi:hypothetical protein